MKVLILLLTSLLGDSISFIKAHSYMCGTDSVQSGVHGIISSPGYPAHYNEGLSCRWIIPTPPNTTLQLRFHDMNIELDNYCERKLHTSCCKMNYISAPGPGGIGIRHYCGDGKSLVHYGFYSVPSHTNETIIQFKTSSSSRQARGFKLEYKIVNEANSCDINQFQCDNGACLMDDWRCDNKADCADESDEHNCDEWCRARGKTMCGIFPDVQCYDNKTEVCDSKIDCDNMKDELHCPNYIKFHNNFKSHFAELPYTCHMMCGSGECYTKQQRCNGVVDCKDSSDEIHCPICKTIRGDYVGWDKRCDDHIDCVNAMDEFGCTKDCFSSIRCTTRKDQCFEVHQRCDGNFDCQDGSDEWNCPDSLLESLAAPCPQATDRRCNNLNCIHHELFCNGKYDCSDGSDEQDCQTYDPRDSECPREEDRRCNNMVCKPRDCWCNGIDDCGDASDEDDCLRNSIIAAAIMAALLCALLVVIAVGCTCRLYNLRMMYTRGFIHHPSLTLRHRLPQNSLTLPTVLDDEFYHPDPPPSYSVAVAECPIPPTCILPSTHQPRRHRRLGSSRRVRPIHCAALTPLVETSPTTSDRVLIPSQCEESTSPGDKSDGDDENSISQGGNYSDDSDLLSL